MHEFIPVVRRKIGRKFVQLKHPSAPAIINRIFQKDTKVLQPFLSSSPNFNTDRIFIGPPLFKKFFQSSYRGGILKDFLVDDTKEYSIIYPDPKETIIKNVQTFDGAHHPRVGVPNMKCYVQLLTTPTADTPGTTLVLHYDHKRYLIGNVAEGTQRAAVQRKLGLLKVSDIFLTGTITWGTTGGILGMILTLADSFAASKESSKEALNAKKNRREEDHPEEETKRWLNIHGGKNLTHLLATARRFVFRKGTPLATNEYRAKDDKPRKNWEPNWKDDTIKVWTMVLQPDAQPGLVGPRKRSHDEFATEGLETAASGKEETEEEREDRHNQQRRSVVSSMFDSTWRLDALVSTKLSGVPSEAAIFYRSEDNKIEKYEGPRQVEAGSTDDIEVLIRNPWPAAAIETLPPTTPSVSSVCYIIKNYPQRGKFNPKEAISRKVKPGPLFTKLANGETVIAEDGTSVTSDMVLGQGKEGGGFAVVELPSCSYIQPLISREEWTSKELMHEMGAIFWILGEGVVADPGLQRFMKDHPEIKHIVSATDICPNNLALESPAEAAIRLHIIDPDRFPIPRHVNVLPLSVNSSIQLPPYIPARAGRLVQIEPVIKLKDDELVHYLNTAAVVTSAQERTDIMKLVAEAKDKVSNPKFLAGLEQNEKDIPSRDAEIITLGTGSALPSKYRNVSATLLRVPGYGSYLIDCGENTLGQLKRVFGPTLPEVLRDLRAIWISHLHADHHLGTASVIKAWNDETKETEDTKNNQLLVASDVGMLSWLAEYADIEDYGHHRVKPIVMGNSPGATFFRKFSQADTEAFGWTSIQSTMVNHCHGAMAVVFNFPNGFKVAYSGDCRPSHHFARIGKGATLLIHEATFDDELAGDALAKKHCTTSEALEIGRLMGAKRILLTHFSQRYQKIPVMSLENDQVAIVAFDYMKIKLGDFAKVNAFEPALRVLYEQEILEDDKVEVETQAEKVRDGKLRRQKSKRFN